MRNVLPYWHRIILFAALLIIAVAVTMLWMAWQILLAIIDDFGLHSLIMLGLLMVMSLSGSTKISGLVRSLIAAAVVGAMAVASVYICLRAGPARDFMDIFQPTFLIIVTSVIIMAQFGVPKLLKNDSG